MGYVQGSAHFGKAMHFSVQWQLSGNFKIRIVQKITQNVFVFKPVNPSRNRASVLSICTFACFKNHLPQSLGQLFPFRILHLAFFRGRHLLGLYSVVNLYPDALVMGIFRLPSKREKVQTSLGDFVVVTIHAMILKEQLQLFRYFCR